MKSTASIILLSCLMFVVGCGREASIDKVDGSTVVVAFGDRLPYEGGVLARILESPSMKSDMVHPNATGYRELAEAVTGLIRQSS